MTNVFYSKKSNISREDDWIFLDIVYTSGVMEYIVILISVLVNTAKVWCCYKDDVLHKFKTFQFIYLLLKILCVL